MSKVHNEEEIFKLLSEKSTMCRFCLDEIFKFEESIPIFQTQYSNILSPCHITLREWDSHGLPLPTLICQSCYSTLQSTAVFLNTIVQSESLLEKFVNIYNENLSENDNTSNNSCTDSKKTTYQETEIHNYENSNNEESSNKVDKELAASIIPVQKHKNRSNKDKLIHKHINSAKSLFKCLQCNKKYKSNYEIQIHMRSHTGEKPFSCPVCEKSFSDRRNLRRHEKIHGGKKEHQCQVCHKQFLHLFSLRIHQRIHTGEKHYVCEICGKSFNTSGELRIHSRSHSNIKPYS
ncbi:zinc finger protein 664-like isoform X2 [Euwallacea fornicatus]